MQERGSKVRLSLGVGKNFLWLTRTSTMFVSSSKGIGNGFEIAGNRQRYLFAIQHYRHRQVVHL